MGWWEAVFSCAWGLVVGDGFLNSGLERMSLHGRRALKMWFRAGSKMGSGGG